MGIGVVSLSTNQKVEPASGGSGPPFAANSADNGLSVDSVSGHIVLGNDLGDIAAPASLLSDREIVLDFSGTLFSITLSALLDVANTRLDGKSISVSSNTGDARVDVAADGVGGLAQMNISSSGGSSSLLGMYSGNDLLNVFLDGAGQVVFGASNFGVPITYITLYTVVQTMQLGAIQVTQNQADVQVTGSVTRRLLVRGKGAGIYNVDRDLDSDVQFNNSGAANFVMPNMVGSNNRAGFIFRVLNKLVDGVTVTAAGGQIIRYGSLATSSGGTLSTTDVGAYLIMVWDSSAWFVESALGAWSLT